MPTGERPLQIVSDTGMDLYLPPEQMPQRDIHIVRHTVTLDGKPFRCGVDIQPDDLYRWLATIDSFPTTSLPSVGDFAEIYGRLAATDPDILSIHVSSGLSGTVDAARAGAAMVPEANITIVDTKTLSAVLGWQVAAAARALQAGWSKEQILALIERIGAVSESIYTLKELKYLIHGGRISQMKGLVASVLNIKPLIGVEKAGGTYVQLGMARTFRRAVQGLVKLVAKQHAPGSILRVQVLHSDNPEGAAILREQLDQRFECTWLPLGPLSPVLGAHTGPSMVGVAYAPQAAFADVP
jgi:DegV family protein with EDD domain